MDLGHHFHVITFVSFNFIHFLSIVDLTSIKVIDTSYPQRQVFFAGHECGSFVAIIVNFEIDFLEQGLSRFLYIWHVEDF